LKIERGAVRALTHFQTAALEMTRTELQQLERLTRSMFAIVADIKGFRGAASTIASIGRTSTGFVPDPDRIVAIVRIWVTMWLAYLMVFYIGDFPGGFGFVTMATVLCMATAIIPHVRFWSLFTPAATSTVFAGLVYIFVMPKLSSFLGLGALLFGVTFAICYLFAAPQQALGRVFGLAMFVTIAAVSNEQTYNFLSVANTALMFPLVFLLLAATANIPYSRRPELGFLRQLRRFFHSCEYLTSGGKPDRRGPAASMERWRVNFHVREVATLPIKLGVWIRSIDKAVLPVESAQTLQEMVTDLQTLARRMHIVIDARRVHQADPLVSALADDLRAWRDGVEKSFKRLSEDPASGDSKAFRDALTRVTHLLEERIKHTLDTIQDGRLTAADGENFYRLLGAFRGLSEAVVDYADHAGAIDWVPWHEERFV
jgi:uncharacterized membrane protein YccC